jgi:hypothetical protein
VFVACRFISVRPPQHIAVKSSKIQTCLPSLSLRFYVSSSLHPFWNCCCYLLLHSWRDLSLLRMSDSDPIALQKTIEVKVLYMVRALPPFFSSVAHSCNPRPFYFVTEFVSYVDTTILDTITATESSLLIDYSLLVLLSRPSPWVL